MTIISTAVNQGSEIKTSEGSTTSYLADEVIFRLGGMPVTQRQAITAAVAFLAAWALKD